MAMEEEGIASSIFLLSLSLPFWSLGNIKWPPVLLGHRGAVTNAAVDARRCVAGGIKCSGVNNARIYVHRNAQNMRTLSHRGALRVLMQRRNAHSQSNLAPETQTVTAATPPTALEALQQLVQNSQVALLTGGTSLTTKPVELFYSSILDAFQPREHVGVFSGDRVPQSTTEGDCSSVAVCIRSLLPLAQQSARHIMDKSIFSLLTMYLSLLVKDPKLTEMARAAYTSVVREFRLFIGSRFQRGLSHGQTSHYQLFLALSTALQLFEYVNDLGEMRSGFLAHHEGMLQLLQISGPEVYQSPYLLQSFSGLRGIIIFVALQRRRPIFLSEPTWIYTPFFYRPKTRREILHDLALRLPELLHRTDELIPLLVQTPRDSNGRGDSFRELTNVTQKLVADFTQLKADLEAWFQTFKQSCSPAPIYWTTDTVLDSAHSYTDPICVPDLQDPKYQLRFQDGQKAGVLICYWSFMLELLMSLIDVQAAVLSTIPGKNGEDMTMDPVCENLDIHRAAADDCAFLILQSMPYLLCCLEGVFVTQSPLSLVQRYFARRGQSSYPLASGLEP
ncbi:hypothetical protein Z517_07569 [Fonsecaea pedrosoi CBS 271.37]|uniref:Uncharacterized protein n=1 Tax=Fonsecaea pedrosoi CBS 271.37 TaxID=1442368 RepID=A0A0D2DJ86_9EURO|nr:uncharacterized protein Z517_07569 [Fonsecaea pedrosoi CBS 271.37]KIW77736.1 hypothetical protein Z517_07569 [Fonsecaea pedrosoi CBS 271.37]